MVTGPMPRNPNATRPKENTAGESISCETPIRLKRYATPIRKTMLRPSQYALKLPATRPDRIFSDAPPSREEVTTSLTCRECIEVQTFTNPGITVPARVPHEIISESFHHKVSLPPKVGIINFETMKVAMMEKIEVIHTSDVKGISKFM